MPFPYPPSPYQCIQLKTIESETYWPSLFSFSLVRYCMSPVSRQSNSSAGTRWRHQLVPVSPRASVWASLSAGVTAPLWACGLRGCRQGLACSCPWISGGNVYTFSLPRAEVEWSSLFCFTVLLEPTDSRVAFVLLRNDPHSFSFLPSLTFRLD